MLLAISNRPIDTNTTYTVGSDVSRFQRSSVPGRSQDNAQGAGGAATSGGVDSRATGPVVRIARGNTVTLVPVGAR